MPENENRKKNLGAEGGEEEGRDSEGEIRGEGFFLFFKKEKKKKKRKEGMRQRH